MSLIYADFAGHFEKYSEPFLKYLETKTENIHQRTVIGITWSNLGAIDKHKEWEINKRSSWAYLNYIVAK